MPLQAEGLEEIDGDIVVVEELDIVFVEAIADELVLGFDLTSGLGEVLLDRGDFGPAVWRLEHTVTGAGDDDALGGAPGGSVDHVDGRVDGCRRLWVGVNIDSLVAGEDIGIENQRAGCGNPLRVVRGGFVEGATVRREASGVFDLLEGCVGAKLGESLTVYGRVPKDGTAGYERPKQDSDTNDANRYGDEHEANPAGEIIDQIGTLERLGLLGRLLVLAGRLGLWMRCLGRPSLGRVR